MTGFATYHNADISPHWPCQLSLSRFEISAIPFVIPEATDLFTKTFNVYKCFGAILLELARAKRLTSSVMSSSVANARECMHNVKWLYHAADIGFGILCAERGSSMCTGPRERENQRSTAPISGE